MVKKYLQQGKLVRIFDTASRHLDKGVPPEKVIKFFQTLMRWFFNNGLLTKEGIDIYQNGIDEKFQLSDKLFKPEGIDFLDLYYHKALKLSSMNYIVIESVLKDLKSKTMVEDLKNVSLGNMSRLSFMQILQSSKI